MPDVYGYNQGRCTICGEIGSVRHKNIYLIGSEGTDMCESCERDLLKYLRDRMREFTMKRKREFMSRRFLSG